MDDYLKKFSEKLRQPQAGHNLTVVAQFPVGDTPFYVHDYVLTTQSEYFKRLMASGMQEAVSREIRLEDCDAEGLEMLLQACYTAEFHKHSQEYSQKVHNAFRTVTALQHAITLADRLIITGKALQSLHTVFAELFFFPEHLEWAATYPPLQSKCVDKILAELQKATKKILPPKEGHPYLLLPEDQPLPDLVDEFTCLMSISTGEGPLVSTIRKSTKKMSDMAVQHWSLNTANMFYENMRRFWTSVSQNLDDKRESLKKEITVRRFATKACVSPQKKPRIDVH